MNYVTVLSAAAILAALAVPASAKSVWEELSETAPRADKVFVDTSMTAPRSVFTDLSDTAPRGSIFEDLHKVAP